MKYKRSIQKMADLLQEIMACEEFCVDTKVLLLILAATLPIMRFNSLVDNIQQLTALRARMQAVNVLRHQYGDDFRDYIIIFAIKQLHCDVSSCELDELIS